MGTARETCDGKAHVFVWDGENWQEQAELIHTCTTTNDAFGHAVPIDVDIIVVGAPYENNKTGVAYIFQRYDTAWQQVAMPYLMLTLVLYFVMAQYPCDTSVIAAVDDRNRQGAVYVFTSKSNSG